jgi:glycine C-acetyltransferase
MEREPELLARLWENVRATETGLRNLGFDLKSESAIFPLIVPVGMNIREAARRFHEAGVFVNSIEYPAVPISQQRFRVSLMATHTRQDINRLLDVVEEVWSELAPPKSAGVQPTQSVAA